MRIGMKLRNIGLLVLFSAFVSACGGSSSGDTANTGNDTGSGTEDSGFDPTKSYAEHDSLIFTAIELSDGRIASAGQTGVVHLWHPADTSTTLATYNGHADSVQRLLELNDGRIASAGDDSTIQIWNPNDPDNGAVVIELFAATQVFTMVELADGRLLAGYTEDGAVNIIEPTSPESIVRTYSGHPISSIIRHIVQIPDGRIVSRRNNENVVHIWDPETLEVSFTGNIGLEGADGFEGGDGVGSIVLADGRIATNGRFGSPAVIWDPADPQSENLVIFDENRSSPIAITQLTDGRIVSGFHIWNPEDPSEFKSIPGLSTPVEALLALNNGGLIVAGSELVDGEILNHLRVWNADEL